MRKLIFLLQWPRLVFYRMLWTATVENHGAILRQPVLVTGKGKVIFGARCQLGVWPSPHFLTGYIHIEARERTAVIEIGEDVALNNNAALIAERSYIRIGAGTMAGAELTIYDSDFHGLAPEARNTGSHDAAPVVIGANALLGSRVTILKGCTIGEGAVLAAGSVVERDIPSRTIAAGNAARPLGKIQA